MPHSESQLVGDLVPLARPKVVTTKATIERRDYGDRLMVPRPPLPPKVPKSMKKLTPSSTSSDLSVQSASKPLPRVSLSRSRTPTNVDMNNNSHFLSLSRNSSFQSVDSFSSFRSTSPSLSLYSNNSLNSRRSLRSLTPRRIFPQQYAPSKTIDLSELQSLDSASTVFDGKLSFVLGCNNQRVHQQFRPSPAHLEAETASRYLSDKISDFLKRTDHINEEWSNHCRSVSSSRNSLDVISIIENQRNVNDEMSQRLARSKSVTNIMIKGFQMAQKLPPTERSNSMCRDRVERSGSVMSVCSNRTTINGDIDTIVDDEVISLA